MLPRAEKKNIYEKYYSAFNPYKFIRSKNIADLLKNGREENGKENMVGTDNLLPWKLRKLNRILFLKNPTFKQMIYNLIVLNKFGKSNQIMQWQFLIHKNGYRYNWLELKGLYYL